MRALIVSFFVLLQFSLPLQVYAQEQAPEAGEAAAGTEETAAESFQLVDELREIIVAEPIKALIAAVFAIFIAWSAY